MERDAFIGSMSWDACDKCKRWNGGKGCDVPEKEFTVTYVTYLEGVICDNFDSTDD